MLYAGSIMIRIMTNDETWLTAAQAAKILRVTERQVNRYGAEGRLRTQRAGQRSDKENAPGSSPISLPRTFVSAHDVV